MLKYFKARKVIILLKVDNCFKEFKFGVYMIKHIVMWKFKEGTEEKMNQFLKGLNGLVGQIEVIRSLQNLWLQELQFHYYNSVHLSESWQDNIGNNFR